jgi:hypothetical protein
VDDIAALARRRPPFVSVYLDAGTAAEDAPRRLLAEWQGLRRDLAGRGAPEEALDAVDAAVADHRGAGGLAVVVDGDGEVLSRPLAEAPSRPVADFAVLPRLGPLLRATRAEVPHVLVVADRTGADIVTVEGAQRSSETVEGDVDAPIRKVLGGGRSHGRRQQRAENTWDRNAAGVATEVADRARATGARLVVAAGDQRAVGLLEQHLPEDVRTRLHVAAHGGRAPGVDEEPFELEVRHVVATVAADDTVAALEGFGEQRGRNGAVADGPGETFAALRGAVVDTLLVHEDPADERTAWFSSTAPTLVALEERTLRDLGVEPVAGRLEDVAVWSALGSGGTVQLVPAHGPNTPLEGLGARLRGGVPPGAT